MKDEGRRTKAGYDYSAPVTSHDSQVTGHEKQIE